MQLGGGIGSFSLPLVIKAGSLSSSTSYVLSVYAFNAQGYSGTSTVSFTTSGPPTSG